MPNEAVVFDMDGLLVDSGPVWNEASKTMAARTLQKSDPAQSGCQKCQGCFFGLSGDLDYRSQIWIRL